MKNYHHVFILIVLLICFGCQQNGTHQNRAYTCKDYKLDVPIEAVDAETNGQKSGDTHFHSNSNDEEVFYSYENYASNDEAQNSFDKRTKGFMFLIRKNKLTDKNGKEVGRKILFLSESNNYVLYWTNEIRLNSVSSKSLPAIEEIEKGCNL